MLRANQESRGGVFRVQNPGKSLRRGKDQVIYVYGADPFDRSPSSKTLLVELLKAGFKRSEITHAKTKEEIPDNTWVLCFGSEGYKHLTGMEEPLGEIHGQLCAMDTRADVLVLPTYSPGYLFHNPHRKDEWKAELELFYLIIHFDEDDPKLSS